MFMQGSNHIIKMYGKFISAFDIIFKTIFLYRIRKSRYCKHHRNIEIFLCTLCLLHCVFLVPVLAYFFVLNNYSKFSIEPPDITNYVVCKAIHIYSFYFGGQ